MKSGNNSIFGINKHRTVFIHILFKFMRAGYGTINTFRSSHHIFNFIFWISYM